MPFDLSKESVEGYCKVFDGVYIVSEYHRPGFSKLMPRLTNRAFIFEADNKKNGRHLMMSGIPGDECIAKVNMQASYFKMNHLQLNIKYMH